MAENELIVIKDLNPVEVYTPEGIENILKTIESKVLSHVPNIETAAGRQDIKSLAYKVARSNTLLDDMGKSLVEEYKRKVKPIDNLRKTVRDTLGALKDKVRQPLTDYEVAEERRKAEAELKAQQEAQARVDAMAKVGVVFPYQQAMYTSQPDFDAILKNATDAYNAEQDRIVREKKQAELQAAEDRRIREEEAAKLAAERAELERIRKEEDAKRKAEEARLREVQRLEQERAAAERAEIERLRREEEVRQRAERDKIEAERRAVEDARRKIEHEAAVEKAKKEAAERAVQEAKEEAERFAREKAEAEQREKEEAARQEALRPDKEKLFAYAAALMDVPTVGVFAPEAVAIAEEAEKRLAAINRYIIEAAQEL